MLFCYVNIFKEQSFAFCCDYAENEHNNKENDSLYTKNLKIKERG